MKSIKGVPFVLLLSALAAPSWAQGTYRAASCNLSDVQAAINQELAHPMDGDIISIPAGTCTWTGTTEVSANFTASATIQGAGAVSSTAGGSGTTGSDNTVIIDNLNHGGSTPSVLSVSVPAGKSFRFNGIAILQNSSSVAVAYSGMLEINGSSTAVRIDHSHFFIEGGAVGLRFDGPMNGVVDHVVFESPASSLTNDLAFHNGAGSNADGSWADTDHFGTSQFFFVEDCRFHNGDIGDAHDGARYVLRYNTSTADVGGNGQMYTHGVTDARGRATRAAEVYNNTFFQPNDTNGGAGNPVYSLNSGTLLFWGNTITRYKSAIQIDYTRKSNATYNYLAPPNGWGNCNGNGTYTAWDGPSPGYPCLDQPARGAGDLLSGNFPSVINTITGTIAWPHQALSPVYVWNNTYNNAYAGAPLITVATALSENTDYYQSAVSFTGATGIGSGLLSGRPSTCKAGPGGNTPGVGYWATDQNMFYVCTATNTWARYYTPYTYPHPLTQGTTTTQGTVAPTNLTATAQ